MPDKPLRILVVEGNSRAGSERIRQYGGRPYGQLYPDVLRSIDPTLACTVVYPADKGVDCLPHGIALADFDGVAWTGSAMSAYDTIPEVTNQLRLAERVLKAGVPVFGSCWGLQVFVTALGGTVRRNPKGWEIGVAHNIALTPEGQAHPLYGGKPGPFDAFAVHMDETERLPEGAVVLATNAMSAVQAIAYESGGASFWGVQYHPEFDHEVLACTFDRLSSRLVADGVLADEETVRETVRAYRRENDPTLRRAPLADAKVRLREFGNWLGSLTRRG